MDPNTTLWLLLDLINQGERAEAKHVARDLERWIVRGGLYPDVSDAQAQRTLITGLINAVCMPEED